jgi:hypothetical protein
MYKWYNPQTGEICKTLKEVLYSIYTDLRYYHILSIIWQYNKNGF